MQTEFIKVWAAHSEIFVSDDTEYYVDECIEDGFYATNTQTHEQTFIEYLMVFDHEYFEVLQ